MRNLKINASNTKFQKLSRKKEWARMMTDLRNGENRRGGLVLNCEGFILKLQVMILRSDL